MEGIRRIHHMSPSGRPRAHTEFNSTAAGGDRGSDSSAKEQGRFLPIANVSRIMKRSLPANTKVSKEAKETVQECVSEFISFVTGEASDKCQKEKRKTIKGDDLLWAMATLGFENYVGPLKVYLSKYRETEGEKNSMVRQADQLSNDEGYHFLTPNPMASNSSFAIFNGGFYSTRPPAGAQGFGGVGGRVVAFGGVSKTSNVEMVRNN